MANVNMNEPRTGTHTVMAVTEAPATVQLASSGYGYHEHVSNPHDEWGARDLLLSMVPFIVATSMRDCAFQGGLIFATAWSWALLFYRLAFWDGKRKVVLPAVDIANCVLFPILLGTAYYDIHALHKWYNVIAAGALAITMLLTVPALRPFTGHYARYAKSDRGGRGMWQGDSAWRKACHSSSIVIGSLFAASCLLSLAPDLTDHYTNASALNIIFNYIVPIGIAMLAPIMMHVIFGKSYKNLSGNNKRPTTMVTGAAPVTTTGAYVASPV